MFPNKHTLHRKVATLFLLWSALAVPAHEFAGGTGGPNDPYQIATAEQLNAIGSNPNLLDKHFVLVNDIDLDPNLPGGRIFDQAVIAPDLGEAVRQPGAAFQGSFDGDGRTIRNMTIRASTGEFVGLFGYIGPNGRVHNLNVDDLCANGSYGAGGLVGYNCGTINRCSVAGTIWGETLSLCVGGLAGLNEGTISQCRASGRVSAGDRSGLVGGLIGENHLGSITNCHAVGVVTGGTESACFGGLAGKSAAGTITDCYARGLVYGGDGSWHLGGLVGWNAGAISDSHAGGIVVGGRDSRRIGGLVGFTGNVVWSPAGIREFGGGSVATCYATGSVCGGDGSRELGGLVGLNWTDFLDNCFATGSVCAGQGAHGLGGLVGSNGSVSIVDCYARGCVSGGDTSEHLGGLVGENGHPWGQVLSCYATGSVHGARDANDVGGLVGSTYDGLVSAYFLATTDGGGPDNGIGEPLSDRQMRQQANFVRFDFDDVWMICEGRDYPHLQWENVQCEE